VKGISKGIAGENDIYLDGRILEEIRDTPVFWFEIIYKKVDRNGDGEIDEYVVRYRFMY
jgi:hypothetical protein